MKALSKGRESPGFLKSLKKSTSKKSRLLRASRSKKLTKLPVSMTSNDFYMSRELKKIDKMFKKKQESKKYPLIGLTMGKKTSSKFFSNLGSKEMDTSKYRKDSFQSSTREGSRNSFRAYRRKNVNNLRLRKPLNSKMVFNSLA